MKRIYLDYAATTPVDPAVLDATLPWFAESSPARHASRLAGVAGWGNPGSLHYFGQQAMAAVDESRERIAGAIGADFREIIFTGSATEANNLALRGAIGKYISGNRPRISGNQRPRLIVSAIEHESVLETAKDLERDGIEAIYLPVDKNGIVDLKKLKSALNEWTILVSVMCANNEIGTIQPIAEIAKIIKAFRVEGSGRPPFHTDAVQAFQYLDCGADKFGVDLMTLSAHKIYGPKGIGALYIRHPSTDNRKLSPIITGGGQEFGLRSGTENVPAIVGFAEAVELAVKNRDKEFKRIAELRNHFWEGLKKIYPKAQLNIGGNQLLDQRPSAVLPNILNVYFPGHEAQDLLTKFDLAGIAASSGSACSARSIKPSHVLKALGYPEKRIRNSIRFSLGRPTTKAEIDEALKRIVEIFNREIIH